MPSFLLLIFEIVGTVSFAVSGAMTAIKHRMDMFGVMILGIITSVGGGVIRDLILGITPPGTFTDPTYALIAATTSLIMFLPAVRQLLNKHQWLYDHILRIMDSVGLGIFTVVGINVACEGEYGSNVFLLLFVGVITGIGGGVLRDVLAGDTPYIFVKHFYATASLIGAACYIAVHKFFGDSLAMIIGASVIVVLRLIAAHYKWSLPRGE